MIFWFTGQPGSGIGYEINEYVPPKDIGKISVTKIREALKNDE